MTFSVMVNMHSGLAGSQELEFGLRSLQRLCAAHAGYCGWHAFDERDALTGARAQLLAAGSENVLVLMDAALVTTSGFLARMEHVLQQHPGRVVVPADPRSAQGEWQIDYASRAGLERYVARRAQLPACAEAPPLAPWIFLAPVHTLVRLMELPEVGTWQAVAEAAGAQALVAQHAFVHSFAGYQSSDRRDILDMLPGHVRRLMDVGGGEGRFVGAFREERSGQGLLVEPNTASVAVAQARGVEALQARFEAVQARDHGLFECISFLDVLEHLEDPLAALQHARTLLAPDGLVLLSIPNVGHWSVVEDLMAGRFDYLPLGILCCTHLRFFTESSLREMLIDAGYEVVTWRNQPSPMPQRLRTRWKSSDAAPLTQAWNWTSLETDSFHVLARMGNPHSTKMPR